MSLLFGLQSLCRVHGSQRLNFGLTEIGVAGVQQACQAWRASRGVTRSFIFISVYDHRISVFKLLDVHVMFGSGAVSGTP